LGGILLFLLLTYTLCFKTLFTSFLLPILFFFFPFKFFLSDALFCHNCGQVVPIFFRSQKWVRNNDDNQAILPECFLNLHVGWSELQSLTAAASLQQQQGLHTQGEHHSHFALFLLLIILHLVPLALNLSLGQSNKVYFEFFFLFLRLLDHIV